MQLDLFMSLINIHNVDLEVNVQMVIDGTLEKTDDASGISSRANKRVSVWV